MNAPVPFLSSYAPFQPRSRPEPIPPHAPSPTPDPAGHTFRPDLPPPGLPFPFRPFPSRPFPALSHYSLPHWLAPKGTNWLFTPHTKPVQ